MNWYPSSRGLMMSRETEHVDVAAIGAGPFNLGFASLAEPIPELSLAVLEATEQITWHPGMMLDGTHLQVPFLADLVTMADPTSPYSFLNYLKDRGRIYPFYIRENFYALRDEFSNYLAWAAEQLSSVRLGHRVVDVRYRDGAYRVSAVTAQGMSTISADRLVLGTGSQPYQPDVLTDDARRSNRIVHSSRYLFAREPMLRPGASDARPKVVTVLGSGQSAAEVILDLLRSLPDEDHLVWLTRAERFFPLEYTKLSLEMTSPEYIDFFHALPIEARDNIAAGQNGLYKGINADLINEIHDELYRRSVHGEPRVHIRTGCTATAISAPGDTIDITLRHAREARQLRLATDYLIMATGYRPHIPDFLEGIASRIRWLPDGRPDVDREYGVGLHEDVFVQNAELHTHGYSAPDLGMGAYRNSVLLNRISGREVYPVEQHISFQEFGAVEFDGLPTMRRPANASTHT